MRKARYDPRLKTVDCRRCPDHLTSHRAPHELAKNALLLSLAASWDDFAELAPLFDVQHEDLPQTAKAQDTLRAQNDELAARRS